MENQQKTITDIKLLKSIISETIETFYDKLLSDENFKVFFSDDDAVYKLKVTISSLLIKTIDDIGNAKENYLKNIEEDFKKVGEIHYKKIGVPYFIFSAGFKFLEETFIDTLMKLLVKNNTEAKIFASNIYFAQSMFFNVRNYISKAYFLHTLDSDIVMLESMKENRYIERPAPLTNDKDIIFININLMINLINLLKNNRIKDYQSYDKCILSNIFSSEEFKIYFLNDRNFKDMQETHKMLHNSIKNIHYFLEKKEYSQVLDIYYTIFKLFTIMDNFIYSKVAEKNIKNISGELDYIRNYDNLTNLLSREKFLLRLNELITEKSEFVLIFLNIDSFKTINERYGYSFGNNFLVKFADLLKFVFRQNDLISRFGKDEFLVIIKNAGDEKPFIERLSNFFNTNKIIVEDKTVPFSVSGGLIRYDGFITAQELIGKAYETVKQAKELGGNKIVSYTDINKSIHLRNEKLEKRDFLLQAMEEDRLIPVFQPVLDISDLKTINKYEALMRIIGKDGKLIAPYEYILIAEEFSFVEKIDLIIIEKSIQILQKHKHLNNDIILDLNLSGKEIVMSDFIGKIEHLMDKYSVEPRNVIFEITETAAIQDIELAKDFISRFKSKGFKFALDDFGIGFSSLFYLKNLNVDYVKIDGYFVKDIVTSVESYYLIKSLASMAKAFNTKTIAEFVESKEILMKLKELDIDYAQGYYIGKPSYLIDDFPKEFIL
ncbi:MAG: EAL domain-containing protein [bacterium]